MIENKSDVTIRPRFHQCSLHAAVLGRLQLIIMLPILFFILLAFVGCAKKKNSPPAADNPAKAATAENISDDARMKLTDYTVVVPPTGDRIWVAKMHSGTADSKSGELTMDEMSCTFYQDGKEQLHATADKANAMVNGKNVEADLRGNVTAVSTKDGQSITAAALRWKSGDKVICVDDFVFTGRTSKGDDYTLRAKSGTISLDLREVTYRDGTIEFFPVAKGR